MAELEIRRAADRAVTDTGWLRSAHSFAFGPHYDPANLSFGPLLANNVDEIQPGDGYPRHRHAGIDILSWVLAGVLEHVDVTGNRAIEAGTLQYLAAGSGIEHTERSASRFEPVRVLQMWLASAEAGGRPRYEAAELTGLLAAGGLVLAASGNRAAPVVLGQPAAELFVGRLPAGARVVLPPARFVHCFLVHGSVEIAGQPLAPEDAARITDCDGVALTVRDDAELLVWSMSAIDRPAPAADPTT